MYEGLGTVLIEAQYSGLPCAVSAEIPKEAQITKKFKYIELNNINKWKNTILDFINNEVNERKKIILNDDFKKFDIKVASLELEKKYFNILEKK